MFASSFAFVQHSSSDQYAGLNHYVFGACEVQGKTTDDIAEEWQVKPFSKGLLVTQDNAKRYPKLDNGTLDKSETQALKNVIEEMTDLVKEHSGDKTHLSDTFGLNHALRAEPAGSKFQFRWISQVIYSGKQGTEILSVIDSIPILDLDPASFAPVKDDPSRYIHDIRNMKYMKNTNNAMYTNYIIKLCTRLRVPSQKPAEPHLSKQRSPSYRRLNSIVEQRTGILDGIEERRSTMFDRSEPLNTRVYTSGFVVSFDNLVSANRFIELLKEAIDLVSKTRSPAKDSRRPLCLTRPRWGGVELEGIDVWSVGIGIPVADRSAAGSSDGPFTAW